MQPAAPRRRRQPASAASLAAALEACRASPEDDKRARLAAALALRLALDEGGAALLSEVVLQAGQQEAVSGAGRALHRCVESSGRTVLAAAAADALLSLAGRLSALSTSDSAGATLAASQLWALAPALESLATLLASWGARAGLSPPLRSLALDEVARHVASVRGWAEAEGDAGEPPEQRRAQACGALARCWGAYAPLALCEPAGTNADEEEAMRSWLSTLASSLAQQQSGELSPQRCAAAQLHALTALSLLLGRVEGRASPPPRACEAAVKPLLDTLALASGERSVALAAAALRVLLLPPPAGAQASAGWAPAGAADAALSALLPALDDVDGISAAAIALVGELVARQPGLAALRLLLSKLGALGGEGEPRGRVAVILAITEALRRGAGQAERVAGDEEQPFTLLPEFAELLATNILPHLSDTNLAARAAAAALLGRLSPASVLPQLLRLLADRAGPTRSSASEGLLCLLRAQQTPASALSPLLQTLLERGSDGGAGGEERKVEERALKLLARWAAADVTPAQWPALIDALLAEMRAAPACSLRVRCASALGPAVGGCGEAAAHLLAWARDELQAQGAPDETEAVAEATQLFRRLQPLLLLRTLPLGAFAQPLAQEALYALPSLCEALLQRSCDAREPLDVRRLCAELVGNLRPGVVFPPLLERASRALSDARPGDTMPPDGADLPQLRSALFSLCSLVATHGAAAVPGGGPAQPALLRAATLSLGWRGSTGGEAGAEPDEVTKTQLGSMECLALLIAAQQQQAAPRRAPVQVLDLEAEHAEAAFDVLSSLLELVSCASETLPWLEAPYPGGTVAAVRALAANAVIISLSRVGKGAGLEPLVSQVMQSLTAALSGGSLAADARTAAFQVLFVTAHSAGAHAAPFAARMAGLACAAVQARAEEEGTRLAALKLLSALMAGEQAVAQEVAPALPTILASVRGVAGLDASAELRSLAEKVMKCVGR